MNFSHRNIANDIINLIAGLLLATALLRYITGLELFSPLCVAIVFIVPLLVETWRFIRAKSATWILILLLGASVFIAIINFGAYSFRGLFYALTIFISALAGHALASDERIDLLPVARFVLIIFFGFFAFKALTVGATPEKINHYLANSSRNAVAAIVIFLQLFYCVTFFIRYKQFPRITPIVTFIICLLCFGRSGVLFGFIILILPWAYYFFSSKKSWLSLIVFVTIVFIVIPIIVVHFDVAQTIIDKTNFEGRGFESPRIDMYKEYTSGMSVTELVIGRSFDISPTIQRYDGNPHSSIILGHHFMGLPYLIWVSLTLWMCVAGLINRGKNRWLFLICLLFMGRVALDILSLPGLFDLIFFYTFFRAVQADVPVIVKE